MIVLPCSSAPQRGGGEVLLTEILSPRIARWRRYCLVSIGGKAREARVEQFELDEGFRPYRPPFASAVEDRVPREALARGGVRLMYVCVYLSLSLSIYIYMYTHTYEQSY